MKIVSFLLFLSMFISFFLSVACFPDDDDDDSSNDDTVDDDAADDDVVDDDVVDDDAIDDDTADDDVVDDDASPKPPTMRLLITGKSGGKLASWVQKGAGWLKLNVPQQGDFTYEEFGPIAIRDGAFGHAAINRYAAYGKSKALCYRQSFGHTWLTFDLDSGWQLDDQQPSVDRSTNIHHLQVPAANNIWVGSEFLFVYVTNGVPFSPKLIYYFDELTHMNNLNNQLVDRIFYKRMTALSVPTEDYGLAWINQYQGDELWIFDGENWTVGEIPPAFGNNDIDWFWLSEPGQGYALGYDNGYNRYVYEQNEGNWEEVPPPLGCENDIPNYLFATEDYVIGLPENGYGQVAWEKRDGLWQCRDLSANVNQWYQVRASVTLDARAFVALYQSYLQPKLLEISADAITNIDLPIGLTEILSVHILGELAPPLSYSPGWFLY